MALSRRGFIGASASVAGAAVAAGITAQKASARPATLPTIATPLSTSGRYIVDANGHRVKMTGVNWAGAHEDFGVPGGLDVLPISTITSQIVSWGFNHVRLPFSEAGVIGSFASTVPNSALLAANPALQGLTVWQLYQAVVSALTSAGIMVIPNNHILYQGWCCSLEDTNGLWYNTNWTNTQYRQAWQTVATTFASNPLVVGYDLKNEPRQSTFGGHTYNPTWDGTYSGTDFAGNYISTGNLVHQYDPAALIICEGINSAGDLSGVQSHPVTLTEANKVVYSVHDYPQGHPSNQSYQDYVNAWVPLAAFVLTQNIAPLWLGEFGLANDSMSALGGSNPLSYGNGLGAGPVSQSYGNWWNNFTDLWGPDNLDADWCTWHLSGQHVQGTEPSTNQLQYNKGDRTWDGLYAQDWQGPANPAQITALQGIMPKQLGP